MFGVNSALYHVLTSSECMFGLLLSRRTDSDLSVRNGAGDSLGLISFCLCSVFFLLCCAFVAFDLLFVRLFFLLLPMVGTCRARKRQHVHTRQASTNGRAQRGNNRRAQIFRDGGRWDWGWGGAKIFQFGDETKDDLSLHTEGMTILGSTPPLIQNAHTDRCSVTSISRTKPINTALERTRCTAGCGPIG